MNISEIERKLIELDRNLHLILEMVREAKEPEEDVVESAVGHGATMWIAWNL